MGKRAAAARVRIESCASDQFRIAGLHSLDRIEDHLHIREVDSTVSVQVRHFAVAVLIDENVGGIAELVSAIARTPLSTDRKVVRRCPEPRPDSHALGVNAVIVEILDHQLELVEKWLAEHHVLRPNLFLVVGNEIPESEMLRHPGVFILG